MYTEQYFLYFIVFALASYLIVTDQSIAALVTLSLKMLKLNVERYFWMIRFHPYITTNKITQWFMMRKYMKEAEKMTREFSKND